MNWKYITIGIGIVAVVGGGFLFLNSDFMKVDKCLDSGGAWDYEKEECIYKQEENEAVIENTVQEEVNQKSEEVEVEEQTFQAAEAAKRPIYPDDYALKSFEVPEGFVLADQQEEEFSLDTVTGEQNFYQVGRQFNTVYENPIDSGTEFGVSVFRFDGPRANLSDEDIESEWRKLFGADGTVLMRYENVLVWIWSDSEEYSNEVHLVAEKLEERLGLQEIFGGSEREIE